MKFIGRNRELKQLREWDLEWDRPFLSVIYGRRRVGKTRLANEAFKDIPFFSFEGLEGQSSAEQKRAFLLRLAHQSGSKVFEKVVDASWIEILVLLSDFIKEKYGNKPVAVLFDEFQWMATGRTKLVSALKFVWDNYFQKQNRMHLVLCGSICSFLVKKVLRSKALHGRVDLEINLKPLRVTEVKEVFIPKRSLREVIELYMVLGGIPRYLEMVKKNRSAANNLSQLAFSPNGFLVEEFDRIFASHFGSNLAYESIVKFLSTGRGFDSKAISEGCSLAKGGRLSTYLEELELAGFIESYVPVDKPNAKRMTRWRLADPYLRFYFKFIEPNKRAISRSTREMGYEQFVSGQKYAIWRGLAFEHLCRYHHEEIANVLGFGSVRYNSGVWFNRGKNGAQVDLLFQRADSVITLCELKFQEKPIGTQVIKEVEKKIEVLPNPNGWTIERVLLTSSKPTEALVKADYFHRILTIEQVF